MPETIYRSILDEPAIPQGAYEIIRGLDKNVRDISSELYVFRREHNRDIADTEILPILSRKLLLSRILTLNMKKILHAYRMT